MKRIISCLAVILLVSLVAMTLFACRPEAKEQSDPAPVTPEFRKDGELKVLGPDGALKASFDIEIATTEAALQTGLKYRESMEPHQGMLFVFDGRQSYGFWMKDTYMSLDMLFINYENEIFHIAESTTPFSEEPIEPNGYNVYTLELLAGICQKYNIETGDTIEWKRLP